MSGRHSGISIRGRDCSDFRLDCSDFRLDCMKGAAIGDQETGSSPGNLLTAMYSLQCILGAPRTVVPRKYDKLEYGIDIPSLS
jgi:hypothetical protein